MKKIITSAFALLITLFAGAQTTLTTTSAIGYTSSFNQASSATAAMVPIGITGNGVTWNCATLTPDAAIPTIHLTVSSPVGTTYAADYPNANWYFTDPALVALLGHHYYKLTADSMVLYGEHTTGNSYEIYQDPEMDIPFPFSLGDIDTNSYSKTNYNSSGSVSSYQTGTTIISYIGFGTLVLPQASYADVALIKNERSNSLGPTTVSYTWIKVSTGEKLLIYETNGGIKVNYVSSTASGIANYERVPMNLFPNPAENELNIHLSTNQSTTVLVKNILGQPVLQTTLTDVVSKVDISTLPSGVYFLEMKGQEQCNYGTRFMKH